MPEDHTVTIYAKKWLLRFTRLKGQAYGYTYFDDSVKPRILVDERLKGGQRLETIVHELLHACLGQTISEDAVTETASVIRRTLMQLGYRQVKDG